MQALAAASKTVDCLKLVHSFHCYFLLIGDFDSKSISVSFRILTESSDKLMEQQLKVRNLSVVLMEIYFCSANYIPSSPCTRWQQLCNQKSGCNSKWKYCIHIACVISSKLVTPLNLYIVEILYHFFYSNILYI